jgi:hypothetical protein
MGINNLIMWVVLWVVGILNLLGDSKLNLIIGIINISLGSLELYQGTKR